MRRTELLELLQPDEILGEAEPLQPGGTRDTFGYQVYPVTSPEDALGSNAVLLDIAPGGSTELEHTVRRGQKLTVRARQGVGDLVIYLASGERRIYPLSLEDAEVQIDEGSTYQYLNTGDSDEHLTVFDRSRPAWMPGDEIPVDCTASLEGLTDSTYLVVWNPRNPGGAKTAGALRLALLEEHDTTAYNQARASQAKFRGEASHWHAAAQLAGSEDIWPVKVFAASETLHISPHRRAPDAIIGPSPDFPVQPDRAIFRGQF